MVKQWTNRIKQDAMMLRDAYIRESKRIDIFREALETIRQVSDQPCVVEIADEALLKSKRIDP
jgi:hypothetical protein